MSAIPQTLLDYITKTFSTPDGGNFLLPFHHADLYSYTLKNIAAEHQSLEADDLTLIMDAQTAQHNKILSRLGHASHIYVAGSLKDTDISTGKITRIDAPETQQFFILFTPSTSLLLVTAPFDGDDDSEDHIFGYWSFHNESITHIAQHIIGKTELIIPAHFSEKHACTISPVAMNLMRQTGNFIVQHQQNAIVQKNDMTLILDILKSLSVRRSTHELLYVFVEKIAASIPTDRCSVVRVWEDSTEAHVLASHEDSSVDDMIIQLDKYPEIIHTLQTTKTTAINDIPNNPITKPIADQLTDMGITSIIVIPIVVDNPKVGTFLLRAIRKGSTFTDREVDFCRIASETASNAIERSDMFDTIQQTNRTLERLATTDALTGLHNRRYFMERLEDEIARSIRYNTPLACVLMDIDNFKSINDTYGHLQGDLVLKEVSRRAIISIRTNDVVARYGGEEFIVLLPQTDIVGAETHATRLLSSISGKPFKGLPEGVPITVSMGLATITQDNELTADALIKAADDALYEAKRTGKNKLVIAQ